ncbi:MAG: hypothetical protein WBP85_17310 [Terracidiphilus sp.]
MANSLSLTAAEGSTGVFECPVCKETINTSDTQCRFCSSPIDPAAAQAAAEKMARINQACSDASFLRTAAVSILVFIGVMFIPFMGLLGIVGYYFLLVAVPFLAIRWWVKFRSIQTGDRDFKRARKTVIVISILVLIPIALAIARLF